MRKVLFLMFLLLLMGLGAASVKAQVRIGGDTVPNRAAVLDLNANDDATPTGNKGALALPRVSLASNTAPLNGVSPITGMLVYNTNTTLGEGIYFWNGSKWVMSTLPSTTSADNGKVATVLNGTWVLSSAVSLLDTTVAVTGGTNAQGTIGTVSLRTGFCLGYESASQMALPIIIKEHIMFWMAYGMTAAPQNYHTLCWGSM